MHFEGKPPNLMTVNFSHYAVRLKSHLFVSLHIFCHVKSSAMPVLIEMSLSEMKAVSFGTTEYILKVYTCDYSPDKCEKGSGVS